MVYAGYVSVEEERIEEIIVSVVDSVWAFSCGLFLEVVLRIKHFEPCGVDN